MPQTVTQVMANPGFPGPAAIALVDQNNAPFNGPSSSFVQPANTSGVVIGKASPGRLWSVVVTTLGTAGLDIYDNASVASGTKLLSIPASAAVGTIYNFFWSAPAANGIVSNGVANCPAVTIYIS